MFLSLKRLRSSTCLQSYSHMIILFTITMYTLAENTCKPNSNKWLPVGVITTKYRNLHKHRQQHYPECIPLPTNLCMPTYFIVPNTYTLSTGTSTSTDNSTTLSTYLIQGNYACQHIYYTHIDIIAVTQRWFQGSKHEGVTKVFEMILILGWIALVMTDLLVWYNVSCKDNMTAWLLVRL